MVFNPVNTDGLEEGSLPPRLEGPQPGRQAHPWNQIPNLILSDCTENMEKTALQLPIGFAPPERKVTGDSGDIRGH